MVVVMVLLTFAVCVAIDHWLNRRERAVKFEPRVVARRGEVGVAEGLPVEGYRLPEEMKYHPGHVWAWVEDADTVRVGMDDFARRLIGRITRIDLPQPGEWVKQGAPSFRVRRNGLQAQMVSPVEGEVVDVNRALEENPGAIHEDPYGKGWLFAVRLSDAKRNLANLIPQDMTRAWMRAAARNLRFKVHNRVGLVYQDGGEPVEDVVAEVGEERWQELTRTFFLT